jgi:hypothetical protein
MDKAELEKIKKRYKLIAAFHQIQGNFQVEARYSDLIRFIEWQINPIGDVPGIEKSLNPDFYDSNIKGNYYQSEIDRKFGGKK